MDLETDDPEKGQLLQKSAHHRELLEEEVKLISEKSEKILTNALVIGGALALTWFLVKSLSDTSDKQKPKPRKNKLVQGDEENDAVTEKYHEPQESGIVSQIGAVLAAQVTGFLLSVAREKLAEYLESHSAKKDQMNGHS